MKTIFLTTALLLTLFASAQAELIQKTIEYKQGDALLEGYLAYDDTFSGQRPGILVVHEWMGLNDYAKHRADMLARLGYVAFAADIYGKGVRPTTTKGAGAEAGKYKGNRDLLRQRVLAGFKELAGQPNVDASKLAAIGYCFGGTTVLELARAGADVKGVVSFHGGLNSPTPEDAQNIKAQVLVLHGADDPFVPLAEVDGFESEMKSAKVKYQLIQYPGAVHGFTNPDNKGDLPGALYNQSADQKSWNQMQKFFDEVLSSQNEGTTGLLRICPDHWISNQMPGPGAEHQREYFVVNGKRVEKDQYDVDWIKKNCDIKLEQVF